MLFFGLVYLFCFWFIVLPRTVIRFYRLLGPAPEQWTPTSVRVSGLVMLVLFIIVHVVWGI